MKKLIPFLVVGAVALVVVVGVVGFVGYRTVSAMSAPARVANAASLYFAATGNSPTADQGLATALGIDVATLQAAYKAAWAEALKQAVAAGKITQSQADQLATQTPGMHVFGLQGNWLSQAGIDWNALLAKQLNISVDQLTAAYKKAYDTSIDQAVTDGRLTQAQADQAKARYALATSTKFQDSLKSAFTAAVNQAVTDGLITQAQADQILSSNTGNGFGFGMRGFEKGFGFGPGMGMPGGMMGRGGHGGRGFRGGFGNGNGNQTNPANPTSPTPTPTPGL